MGLLFKCAQDRAIKVSEITLLYPRTQSGPVHSLGTKLALDSRSQLASDSLKYVLGKPIREQVIIIVFSATQKLLMRERINICYSS